VLLQGIQRDAQECQERLSKKYLTEWSVNVSKSRLIGLPSWNSLLKEVDLLARMRSLNWLMKIENKGKLRITKRGLTKRLTEEEPRESWVILRKKMIMKPFK